MQSLIEQWVSASWTNPRAVRPALSFAESEPPLGRPTAYRCVITWLRIVMKPAWVRARSVKGTSRKRGNRLRKRWATPWKFHLSRKFRYGNLRIWTRETSRWWPRPRRSSIVSRSWQSDQPNSMEVVQGFLFLRRKLFIMCGLLWPLNRVEQLFYNLEKGPIPSRAKNLQIHGS